MKNRAWTAGVAAAMAVGVGAVVTVSLLPRAQAACCYFAAQEKDINQPGQKAFIAWEASKKIEAFTVQPKFEGNAVEFGMVIPTPAQPKLDEMPRDFFKDLAIYTILMPLPSQIWAELVPYPMPEKGSAPGGGVFGDPQAGKDDKHGVKVLESGVVGSLDYKIISAEQASGLFDWLKENKYTYSGDESTLDFYIKKRWIFTVMKIDPKQMKKDKDGNYLGEVTPTRFTFPSEKCIYPLKITQISVKTETDALFYVQSADEMDLEGDLSWKHSYRVMWLTYMLGCSANPEQQAELQERNAWVAAKKAKDPKYETTKLEWARKLGDAELAVLDDPLKNYAQMGGGTLPDGSKFVSPEEFLKTVWDDFEKKNKGSESTDYPKKELERLRATYTADKGAIVHSDKGQGSYSGEWMWYPKREAPDEDVKGLARLKGMLQKGMWLTKFRKVLRKDEMTDDLVIVPVPAGKEDEYVRIMPTSPP